MLESIKDTGPGMTFHRLGQAGHGDLVALRRANQRGAIAEGWPSIGGNGLPRL